MEPSFNHIFIMSYSALQLWYVLQVRFHWQRFLAAFRMITWLRACHIWKKSRFRRCVSYFYITQSKITHTHRAVTNNHCHIVFKCIHQLSLSTGRKMHSKLKNTNLLKCSLLFSTHHQSWCTFIAETHLLFNSINQQHRCCTA